MKKEILMATCLCLCVACATDDPIGDWNDSDTQESGSASGGEENSSGGSLSSVYSLDFDVSWDDVADDAFVDAAETVVTDSSDDEYDDYVENSAFSSVIKIVYADGSAAVSGDVAGVTVTAEGAYVTVNSTVGGVEYQLSGSASDGALKVYSEKKFKLTLDGVSLTSTKGAAINIQSKKLIFVESATGTVNNLTDAVSYTNNVDGEDQKACLFAEGQLIFSGTGLLTVNGNYKHGICSDDYIRLRSGSRIVVASAPKDALHANENIIVGGGLLKLTPSGDGLDCEEGGIDIRGGLLKANITGTASKGIKATTDITLSGGQMILLTLGDAEYDSDDNDLSSAAGIKCDGNLTVSGASVFIKSTGAAGKGINCDGMFTMTDGMLRIITTGKQYIYGSLDSSPKGLKTDGTLTISGGSVWVRTTGGEGSEGIESKSTLVINNGDVRVYAYDDCINATTSIAVNGGTVYCYSSGNDGIDSNGTLTVAGGTIVSCGTASPEEGFDCDQNTFKITGGTLIGVGGSTSMPTSSVCTQRSVVYGGSGSGGTLVSVVASDGTHVMSFTLPRAYSQMTMLFSGAKLVQDTGYTIYTGGNVSGGNSYCGLTTGGTYKVGTQIGTFTASTMVTSVGSTSGGGGFPGGRK
ncbi:carbohydrate-binding domain-containing protein [Bacteroides heparinolyticus]|uniref:carbohydrate-binding domain-containing protein n=1 Tax=Prevotella heparinolytica TaxID=28113 RepID=UPI0035A04860